MSDETATEDYFWKDSCAVFVDAVGYSTSIEQAPEKTRRKLSAYFDMLEGLIKSHEGRIIDKAGDGMFAEFAQVDRALICMQKFQADVNIENDKMPIDRRMRFRCGIAYGRVMQEKHLISGPKVNVAARLQQLAEPGSINLDGDAYREVQDNDAFAFADIGFRILKGMSNPVRIWRCVDETDPKLNSSLLLAAEYKASLEGGDGAESARGIAVLPFEVPPGKTLDVEDDAYMALGLASDIADGMARSHWLKVISPRSSMNYSDASYEDNEIAKELNVRYLLKGRMRIAGDAVRISASLIDCPTGHTIWSENYDRREQSIFDIQDEITNLIVAKIEPEFLRHEAQRAADNSPRNVTAWDLLMRARWHFWRGTSSHIKLALACAEKALQLDPDSAQTLALLSFCHMTQVWTAASQDPAFQTSEALRFARQAVSIDDTNANAHFTLGTALSLAGEIRPAMAAERRALELNPNFAGALGELARLLAFDGQAEEARRAALKAIELSPTDPHISLWVRSLALASFVEGDYSAAADFAVEAAAKRPDWFFHHALVASCAALDGDIVSAQHALAESSRLLPHYPVQALKAGHPFTNLEILKTLEDGLRLAGWQES